MVSFPNCKINLGLHVLSKRGDGFHEIETCFYPIPWTDILEIIPSKKLAITTTGLKIPGAVEENLCFKAYELLRHAFDLPPIAMHLHKIVPMGAGLGAGSSDAAHALKLLNQVFKLKLKSENLKEYASQLGSDCAFFIDNVPSIGTGKGDQLIPTNVDLLGKHIVIVKPPIHISTQDAYAGIEPKLNRKPIDAILLDKNLSNWRTNLTNDFERAIFLNHPAIEEVKEKLYASGAAYASMSGSGSAVFGIFDSKISFENEFKEMTYWSAQL